MSPFLRENITVRGLERVPLAAICGRSEKTFEEDLQRCGERDRKERSEETAEDQVRARTEIITASGCSPTDSPTIFGAMIHPSMRWPIRR